ncbi:MAG: Fe-S cluster assembly protein NifU [Cyanobacteria bacterium SIG30]|nr:Fe-S cluster assembly protein NifU [Cyanobacteria bacterium SIG30]
MWDYSEKVKEHYTNPKNVGSIKNATAIGEAGSLSCGDALKLYLKIDKNGIITDAKFQTFGCGSAVASSSILTEMIIGKHVEEAKKITNQDIADMLGGLPPAKMHCSVMGKEALEDALKGYFKEEKPKKENKIICNCFGISKNEIIEAIKKGAKTLEEIQEATYAGGACGGCKNNIKKILEEEGVIETSNLTPVQFALKVNNVLEKLIATELAKDSGGVELVDVKGKEVYVKLIGACKSCCNSTATLKNFVEAQLKEHVDKDIVVIEVQQ